ncbi:MAG: hypothetical protein STHCBS139747_005476 [Sporothrix thermara]
MASPAKRRVLAPLDANTTMAAASPLSPVGKQASSESSRRLPLSPPSSAIAKKRTLAETSLGEEAIKDVTITPKKQCFGNSVTPSTTATTTSRALPLVSSVPTPSVAAAIAFPRPSLSPATSSVFDVSAMVDTSQATNITEPDAEAPRAAAAAAAQAPRTLTREQSRQRAEILKLRLGLARYKVRTGQVDVPLEHLRVVPSASALQRRQQQQQQQQQQPRTVLPVSREWSAGEWVRQQQEQTHAVAAAQPRQQPPLPQRWALWGPASSSAGGAPNDQGRNQGGVSAASSNAGEEEEEEEEKEGEENKEEKTGENEDDGDELDSRPLPQQPRHHLDAVDVIEDSDVSDHDGPRRPADEEDEDEDEEEEEEDGDLPQLPQIRRLSPTKKSTGTRYNPLATPRGNRLLVEDGNGSYLDGLTSSAMRGSAVNGLLSLARS